MDSLSLSKIDEDEILCTIGFDFCVTKISSMSNSLLGFVVKNSGKLFMMDFWMALSVELYSRILVYAVGKLVIFVNTS